MADSDLTINELWRDFLLGQLDTPPEVKLSSASEASTGTPTTAADVTVDATAGGVVLLAANASRKAAIIQNTGVNPMRVRIGADPTATTGIQVPAGTTLELTQPFIPTGQVKAIREGGSNTTASVTEIA